MDKYLSGLVVSMLILLMGFELLKSSVSKIRFPEPIEFSWISVVILVLGIGGKLYMSRYNGKIGAKINATRR